MTSEKVDINVNKTPGARADNFNNSLSTKNIAVISAIIACNLALSLLSGNISPVHISWIIAFYVNVGLSLIIILYFTCKLMIHASRKRLGRKIDIIRLATACVSIVISTQDSKIGVSSDLWFFLYSHNIVPTCSLNECKYVSELINKTDEVCGSDMCAVILKYNIFDECEYRLSTISKRLTASEFKLLLKNLMENNITIIRANRKLVQTRACKA